MTCKEDSCDTVDNGRWTGNRRADNDRRADNPCTDNNSRADSSRRHQPTTFT